MYPRDVTNKLKRHFDFEDSYVIPPKYGYSIVAILLVCLIIRL